MAIFDSLCYLTIGVAAVHFDMANLEAIPSALKGTGGRGADVSDDRTIAANIAHFGNFEEEHEQHWRRCDAALINLERCGFRAPCFCSGLEKQRRKRRAARKVADKETALLRAKEAIELRSAELKSAA